MWDSVEYLKQSSLVAKVQRYFGISEKKTNKRNFKNSSVISENVCASKKSDSSIEWTQSDNYVIENKFWYYLFLLGTYLGDEIFYSLMIPFWFWNIDGAVARKVVFTWTISMYIGQGCKEIIKWPRPTYPAIRLQKKWSEEYGMPSTHAISGLTMPFSVIIFTMNRYIYSVSIALTIATIWCLVICISRIYFGMHTILDVIVGLFVASIILVTMIPIINFLDYFWLSSPYSIFILFFLSIAAATYFPKSDKWTPTRGDTTIITSFCCGIHIAAWTNFNLGNMIPYLIPPPFQITWPSSLQLVLGAYRNLLGFILFLLSRNMTKFLVKKVLNFFFHTVPENDKLKNYSKNSRNDFAELTIIYITYFGLGFNVVYVIPIIFRYFGIEKSDISSEVYL